jgi:hypothetical protein
MARGKYHPPRFDGEEIDTVHVDIDVAKEFVDVFGGHALTEAQDLGFWIHVGYGACYRINLRHTQGRHERAGLAIEVVNLEAIEIREAESTNPQASQCERMGAADAAQACDGDPRAA